MRMSHSMRCTSEVFVSRRQTQNTTFLNEERTVVCEVYSSGAGMIHLRDDRLFWFCSSSE